VLRCIVEKFNPAQGEFWTNVYHFGGSNPATQASVGQALANAERLLYGAHILITKFRIDDAVPNTDNYHTVSMNAAGQRTGTSEAQAAPLFVVARIDFNVAAGGRPCRKFLRVLSEPDTVGVALQSPIITLLNSYITTCLAQGIMDPDGNLCNSGAVWPNAAMRQLRRGSKKKVTP
jgi:hypothetical protein